MIEENLNKELFNKNNPFKIPEGYFEDFNSNLFHKIENESEIVKVTFWHSWKYKVAVAASIAVLAVFSFSVYQFNYKQNLINKNIAVVIDNNTETELSFFDENHIIDEIATSDIEQKIEGNDIIDFLVNENIDENAIAEAY
ncbi:MAG: hypothetical protein A2X08_01485 [Bacteroidetes bacterium GWA2_32_17]|nr:MAG: hypothetical protein A2X08_01485 [Bacteroidetes bacterium GWA2_32_17]